MQATRPVFLDLQRIKLPIPGETPDPAPVERFVDGVFAIPFAAILFHQAKLPGPAGFDAAATTLDHWFVKLTLLVLAWGVLHHLFAGIRYLLLDLGLGVDLAPARRSAWIAIVAAVVVLVIGGGLAL